MGYNFLGEKPWGIKMTTPPPPIKIGLNLLNYLISVSKACMRNLRCLYAVQRASSKLVRVGWGGWTFSDNRANLSSTATEVGLPTGTELGNKDERFRFHLLQIDEFWKFEFILMEKSCRMCRSPRILISTFVNGLMVISVKLEGLNHSTIMIQIPVTAT